jgi:hypothetical protein
MSFHVITPRDSEKDNEYPKRDTNYGDKQRPYWSAVILHEPPVSEFCVSRSLFARKRSFAERNIHMRSGEAANAEHDKAKRNDEW